MRRDIQVCSSNIEKCTLTLPVETPFFYIQSSSVLGQVEFFSCNRLEVWLDSNIFAHLC